MAMQVSACLARASCMGLSAAMHSITLPELANQLIVSQARPNLCAGRYRLEMISARGKWVWYISQVKPVSIENFIEPIRLSELERLLMT